MIGRAPMIAAGLLLNADNDREEGCLRHRHALGQFIDRLAQWDAERLGLGDVAELGLDRLGRFQRNHADAVVERQA